MVEEDKEKKRRPASLKKIKDDFEGVWDIETLSQGEYNVIGAKGTGVVIKGSCAGTPKEFVAIKFYAPHKSLFTTPGGNISILYKTTVQWQREVAVLTGIDHPNLQYMLSSGELNYDKLYLEKYRTYLKRGMKIPFIVSRYIDGVDLDEWINTYDISSNNMISILVGILRGLSYLHSVKHVRHFDLRGTNIIIRRDTGQPVLVDYGLAKRLDENAIEKEPKTSLDYDDRIFPPEIVGKLIDIQKKRDEEGNIDRKVLLEDGFPDVDLAAFGMLLKDLLAKPKVHSCLNIEIFDKLSFLAQQLSTIEGLTKWTAERLLDRLSTLDPSYLRYGELDTISALNVRKQFIQLPNATFCIGPEIQAILDTKAFRRLRLVKQLGLLDHLYPGATQTRYAHSLSVLGLCEKLLVALQRDVEYWANLGNYESQRRIVAMVLLHDINHFPFLHYFQEIKFEEFSSKAVMELVCDGKQTGDSPSISELLEGIGITTEMLHTVLQGDFLECHGVEHQFVNSIINSAVDLDKLAYLKDDSLYTGVPFGSIPDTQALFRAATIKDVNKEKDEAGNASSPSYHICFTESALPAIESVILARYWNFMRIYWHRVNRAISAMLTHVIFEIYGRKGNQAINFVSENIGASQPEALRYLDTHFQRITTRRSPISALAIDRDSIYKCILECPPYSLGDVQTDKRARTYQVLEEMTRENRILVARLMGERLSAELDREVGPDDILIDVPGRGIVDFGQAYILFRNGETKEIKSVSETIKGLSNQFKILKSTIRVFTPKSIRKNIRESQIDMYSILDECTSQIQSEIKTPQPK